MSQMRSQGGPAKGKATLKPPEPVGRRKSAAEATSTLSDFERAYLEKLRNHECPKARVKFLPDDEVPAGTDFVFEASEAQPRQVEEDEFAVMSEFAARRSSVQFLDPAETDRLSRELDQHKYKSYYKNISKSMKAFDATYAKGSNPKED